MLADGLTKALTAPKFELFRKAIGVVDAAKQLAAREAREITLEDLEAREDLFEGGEVDVTDPNPVDSDGDNSISMEESD